MTQSVRDFEKSMLADNTITAYRVAKVTTTGVDIATAGTDAVVGVFQDSCAAAEQARFRHTGTTKVTASAAIVAGAKLKATTGGKVVTTTADHDNVIAIALEAAAADGDIIEALLVNFTISA